MASSLCSRWAGSGAPDPIPSLSPSLAPEGVSTSRIEDVRLSANSDVSLSGSRQLRPSDISTLASLLAVTARELPAERGLFVTKEWHSTTSEPISSRSIDETPPIEMLFPERGASCEATGSGVGGRTKFLSLAAVCSLWFWGLSASVLRLSGWRPSRRDSLSMNLMHALPVQQNNLLVLGLPRGGISIESKPTKRIVEQRPTNPDLCLATLHAVVERDHHGLRIGQGRVGPISSVAKVCQS